MPASTPSSVPTPMPHGDGRFRSIPQLAPNLAKVTAETAAPADNTDGAWAYVNPYTLSVPFIVRTDKIDPSHVRTWNDLFKPELNRALRSTPSTRAPRSASPNHSAWNPPRTLPMGWIPSGSHRGDRAEPRPAGLERRCRDRTYQRLRQSRDQQYRIRNRWPRLPARRSHCRSDGRALRRRRRRTTSTRESPQPMLTTPKCSPTTFWILPCSQR